MLDTVFITLEDWEIGDNPKLIVENSPMDLETGELTADFHLWTDTRGREQRGKKAYRNTDNINITISPKPSGDVIASGHFSVPKVHNGENYYSVGRDGTQAVIKNFGDLLEDTGIKTNIDRAHFSRIDTFKNVITDEPFMTYSPLFSSLKASRKNTRSYGTTFLWENTQQQLTIYDKLVEMEAKAKKEKREIDISKYPAQTMRFEYRLTKKRKIENTLGFSQVRELPSNWGELERCYIKAWERDIFNRSIEDIEVLSAEQVKTLMEHFIKDDDDNYYLNRMFDFWGTYRAGSDFGIEPLKMAVREIEEERGTDSQSINQKVYRLAKKLREARRERDLLLGSSEGKTMASLYEELHRKVCLN